MASGDFTIGGIIFTIFGIVLFFFGLYIFRFKRLIENIPTSKIRSIAMGLVEIFGQAVASKNNILKSPFTNNDCVYYKYNIDEYRSTGKSAHWVTIKKGEERRLFYLKDETGHVLINPQKAKISIKRDNCFHSGLGKDPPENVKSFLRFKNVAYEGFLFGINKKMRYIESYIAVGDNVYIMGTAADNPFVEEASAETGVDDIVIQKGKHDKLFYITDRSETKLLKNLNAQMYVLIGLGLLFISIGVILIIL